MLADFDEESAWGRACGPVRPLRPGGRSSAVGEAPHKPELCYGTPAAFLVHAEAAERYRRNLARARAVPRGDQAHDVVFRVYRRFERDLDVLGQREEASSPRKPQLEPAILAHAGKPADDRPALARTVNGLAVDDLVPAIGDRQIPRISADHLVACTVMCKHNVGRAPACELVRAEAPVYQVLAASSIDRVAVGVAKDVVVLDPAQNDLHVGLNVVALVVSPSLARSSSVTNTLFVRSS